MPKIVSSNSVSRFSAIHYLTCKTTQWTFADPERGYIPDWNFGAPKSGNWGPKARNFEYSSVYFGQWRNVRHPYPDEGSAGESEAGRQASPNLTVFFRKFDQLQDWANIKKRKNKFLQICTDEMVFSSLSLPSCNSYTIFVVKNTYF